MATFVGATLVGLLIIAWLRGTSDIFAGVKVALFNISVHLRDWFSGWHFG
ncbi:MAG TPA: hypothetical protein VFE46_07630 [Pirellulales bacterium]|nr:hypothetical protein [Pirellulales bacterium]